MESQAYSVHLRTADNDEIPPEGQGKNAESASAKNGQYQIGWICALPLEVEAARAMLDPSPRPTKPPAKRLRKGHFSSSSTDYVVEGTVNGIRTEASPDTGSDECIISSHFASKLGQKPAAGTEKTITLANQKTVESTGMIEVLWKFANDPKPHSLTCWILPGSSNDFVLGSRFLRATKTLTTSMHRITKVFRSSRFRLRLLGEERQRILGAFNNQVTTALADTGSDLMLVSLDRVLSHGLSMSSGRNDRTEVELADGSRTWTCGIVKNATWRIGESPVRCDFHVLDGLPADVILSKDYLFEQNIFANHFESSFDIDSVEGISLLCGVRVIEEGLYDLDELEQEFLRDIASQNVFNFEAVKKERVRRSLVVKKIAALPLTGRPEALRREEDKKRRWDTARARHKLLWPRPP